MEIEKKEEYKRLLHRVLHGTATPAEYERFVDLVKSVDTDDQPDAEIMELLKSIKSEQHFGDGANRVYNRLMESLHRPQTTRWWIAAAASLILLATASVIWLRFEPADPAADGGASAFSAPRVFKDKQLVHLPDGSTVILNAGSELRYTAEYDLQIRAVQLTGEAFFDVTHNPDRPFVVKTGNTTTTVLGTAFNINSTVDKVNVVVTRGKVKVADNEGHSDTITPNQQITVIASEHVFNKETVEAQRSIAWTSEFVMFESVSMLEAIEKIERQYAIRVKLSNPALGRCHIEGRFLTDTPVETVLFVICGATNSEFRKMNDGSFVIDGVGCKK